MATLQYEAKLAGHTEGYAEGHAEGIQEGEQKKALLIARNMKAAGFSTEIIFQTTGINLY